MRYPRLTKSLIDTQNISLASDPKYRTIEGLRTHPYYLALRGGQRKFLEAYLSSGGDRIAAIRASNNPGSDQCASVMAARHMNNWRIQHLIAEYRGHTPPQHMVPLKPQELEVLISHRIRASGISDAAFLEMGYLLLKVRDVINASQRKLKPEPEPVTPSSEPEVPQEVEEVEPEPEPAPEPVSQSDYFAQIRAMEKEAQADEQANKQAE